ncbi:DUF6479 family protein [Streptomyces sp. NPDC052225]|uniref:DUF6479 family protein n=1 Tax=Streptomyces sp. NPDC052225 TaxID=3154949 RepID=UPI003448B0EA
MNRLATTTVTALPDVSAAFVSFAGGLVVALALIWAVWLGIRIRRREPGPPAPEEQPKLPDSGPVREVQEVREPEEMPKADDDSARLTPHQLKHQSSKRSDDQSRHRWSRNGSGAFGSGGPGRT